METFYFSQKTAVGRVQIAVNSLSVTNLFFSPVKCDEIHTEIHAMAFRQLDLYFSGKLREFSLPLAPNGTVFQQKIWASLQRVPFGETRTYKDIAQEIGQPKACRAVGNANGKNPIPIIIPCHRIIRANGSLGGYSVSPEHSWLKEWLLNAESGYLTSAR